MPCKMCLDAQMLRVAEVLQAPRLMGWRGNAHRKHSLAFLDPLRSRNSRPLGIVALDDANVATSIKTSLHQYANT